MLKTLQDKLKKYPPIVGDLIFVVIGMILAVFFYHGLGIALDTSEPIVTVVSYSMYPTLDRGDLLVLKGIDPDEIDAGNRHKEGDIIVYVCPSKESCPGIASAPRLIVHRAYEKHDDGSFSTWGDNNRAPDPWTVEEEWIKGKVIFRVPFIGYPRLLLGDIAASIMDR